MSAKKSGGPLIGDNRKARHIYEYLETIEAGISLTGPEVKSLRAGQVNLRTAMWSSGVAKRG